MTATSQAKRSRPSGHWARLIPEEQWHVLTAGRDAARVAGAPMLLGGAFALAAYTGRWRNTKDIDVIVPPGRQEAVVAALREAGFEDYFAREAYDRSWIFRGYREGVILDVIWSLPNHRVPVDAVWFEHARPIRLHGENYAVVPAEELIRVKLYVMQRERCDWVDVLNVLAGAADDLDWAHLVARMGRDLPLLQAVLAMFAWLAPARARAIPAEWRERFGIEVIDGEDLDATERRRVALFDSRPWWAAHQPEDKPLERRAMLIGAMNHPGRPLETELRWMADLELDFVDLTLEPPCVASWQVEPAKLKNQLAAHGFARVIGHTAFYLPIGSSFRSLRATAIDELKRCLDVFAAIGARWMNVHPDAHAPFYEEGPIVERNVASLRALIEHAHGSGVGVMVENVPGRFNTAAQLAGLLEPLPELGLHLDIGHCNLGVERNTAEEVLERFARRVAHVHLHDNRGGHADLHLALGMGNMDVPRYVRALRRSGYDGTITLEVFSEDPHFLEHSRDRLREWWTSAAAL